MPHKIDVVGTRIVKPKSHNLKIYKGKWTAISGGKVLLKSNRKFSSQGHMKKNVVALKRFFERLTYEEIDLAFRKKA